VIIMAEPNKSSKSEIERSFAFRFYKWMLKKDGVECLFMPFDDWLPLRYHFIYEKLGECAKCKQNAPIIQLIKEREANYWKLLEICNAFETVLTIWVLDKKEAIRLIDEWAQEVLK